MKLANPLYYPMAVLAGAIALVAGVRVARLPSVVMIPVSVVVATAGATVLQGKQPQTLGLENPALEQELQGVLAQSQGLAAKADELRAEATRLLTEINEMELLGTVQYACDRAHELPGKIEGLARRMHGSESLLSVPELQQQLQQVEAKIQSSSGVARQSLETLATSLQRNIDLAKEGQDARQAQVVSLSTMILDAAGVLQSLQNKLRTADLTNVSEATELRSLSEEFNSYQENVDLLVFR
jgi:chromosome segregation ATPase